MKSSRWINIVVLFVLTIVMISGRSVGIQGVEAAPMDEGVLFVKPVPSGAEDCSTWDDACELQDALDAALYGDQIWVATGIYTPTILTDTEDPLSATFEMKSGIRIYGGFYGSEVELTERDWETNITVLSGDLEGNDFIDSTGVITDTTYIVGSNVYHVVISESVTETAVLDGFTITGGRAWMFEHSGGGMYNWESNPLLSNLTFSGNMVIHKGAGIYNASSNPKLTNVTFSGNTASGLPDRAGTYYSGYGGGMFNENSDPVLTNVTFIDNSANESGGGMYNAYSNPVLKDVIFQDNRTLAAWSRGGGMLNYSSKPELTKVTFRSNGAFYGGGMSNESSSPVLIDVMFNGNGAWEGGGMSNVSGIPVLINVIFSGNRATNGGGGMINRFDNPVLINVTSSNNTAKYGGGVYNSSSSPVLTNSTLWGNTAEVSGSQIYNEGDSFPTISYSDIQGGCELIVGNDCSGGGNIDADPLFFRDPDPGADGIWGTEDDDYGNLRLGPLSPAIDAGDNTAVPIEVTNDLDGNLRFTDITYIVDTGNGIAPIVDMGAYEAIFRILYLPLITH